MQDINMGNAFDNKKESMPSTKQNEQTLHRSVGTAFSELDKSRKIAVIFLAFFSVGLFFAWGFTTKNRISSPFNHKVATGLQTKNNEEDNSINKDSDGDGLSDEEEENNYHTSPYLEDTDSDGILDGDELLNGTNPNCKEGNTCVDDVLQEESDANDQVQKFVDENINLEINSNESEENISEALKGNSDAETLRKMLLDSGMDKDILATISDDDLLNSYKEILQ